MVVCSDCKWHTTALAIYTKRPLCHSESDPGDDKFWGEDVHITSKVPILFSIPLYADRTSEQNSNDREITQQLPQYLLRGVYTDLSLFPSISSADPISSIPKVVAA